MKLRDLFESDVTRDIPPVVYFHEQSPEKLAAEVDEYIITGGFPETHPHHKRVPNGIHEQYVRLLTAIADELDKPGGPELPASWISGFYGSGKSSFAKLLGLALDGVALPDGRSLATALLDRDRSPRKDDLHAAYKRLRQQIDPLSVVFDIGGVARDGEHIHTAAVRQVQKRLNYCADPHVAEMELKLERDGQWKQFEQTAARVLSEPWEQARHGAMAEDDFSLVMYEMFPEHFSEPTAWFMSRAGTYSYSASVEEATRAIADMLRIRASERTLFVIVDEVSQYVHQDTERMLKLQSFVSDLGQRLKGKVWLLATGQEKLDQSGGSDLSKMKDRFPESLRVHLAATNIRDVVHKRLLSKTPDAIRILREQFAKHRNDLRLFAYGCDDISEEDFVDVYPLLPGHIDLILQITSALRTRSSRAQGDDQAIRGLLQLLGELFRGQNLAELELGALITIEQVYQVQHTALDSDIQSSMARVFHHCAKRTDALESGDTTDADDADPALAARVAKAVALLELLQESMPTTAELVARCLYDRLDRGPHIDAVTEALESLRRHNLLGYSEKHGYKIQSTSGEEWERERRDIGVPPERISELVQETLKQLVAVPDKPRLDGRPFPFRALFSDGRRAHDAHLVDPRDPTAITVDFRYLPTAERGHQLWLEASAEARHHNRLLWVCGDRDQLDSTVRQYGKSAGMVRRYKPRRESLSRDRQRLLLDEEANSEQLASRMNQAVGSTWLAGRLYFRGKAFEPAELGGSFGSCLGTTAERILRDLFPHFVATRVSAAELLQLIEPQLNAPSPKYLQELGILSLDAGRYVPSCHGLVPRRVLEYIQHEKAVSGASLLAHFGGPPYGYAPDAVRACVVGLLRGSLVRIRPEKKNADISAVRDAGVRELFKGDKGFKRSEITPAGEDVISRKMRVRICKFFENKLGVSLDRENDAIADAVSEHFPAQMQTLRTVFTQLRRLPTETPTPKALTALEDALERCYRLIRQTEPTVREVANRLDALTDGVERLAVYAAELTDPAIDAVRAADDVARFQLAQLMTVGMLESERAQAGERICEQLRLECPWRDIDAIDTDIACITQAYADERRQLLRRQEQACETVRRSVKARDGFATLSADNAHRVLRPITEAMTQTSGSTDEHAVAPTLEQLRDRFERALARAEDEANDRLDAIISAPAVKSTTPGQPAPVQPAKSRTTGVRKVSIQLKNREIRDADELERVLDELRQRVLEQLKAGGRVRLV